MGELVQIIVLFLSLVALVYAPGMLLLRLLRVRMALAMGAAPAVSFATIGCAALLTDSHLWPFQLRWNWITYGGAFVLMALVAFALGRRIGAKDLAPGPYVKPQRRYVVAGTVLSLVAIGIHSLPLFARTSPGVPSDLPDQIYHYNAINLISETGNASMLSAMEANHGIRVGPSTFYPTVWHGLLSLVTPTDSVITASHVLAYLVIPMVWIVSLVVLAFVSFPRSRTAVLFAPVVSTVIPAFPSYLTVVKGFWPHSLALAALPGVIALGVATYHLVRWKTSSREKIRSVFIGSIAAFIALLGVTATHPSVLYTLGWIAAPTVFLFGIWLLRVSAKQFNPAIVRLIGAIAFLAIVSLTVFLTTRGPVASYIARPTDKTWDVFAGPFVATVTTYPMGNGLAAVAVAVLVGVVLCYGIYVALSRAHTSWIAYGWIAQTALILASYFPLGGLTSLTGIWYSDSWRLLAIQTLPFILLVSLALSTVWEKVSEAKFISGPDPASAPASRRRFAILTTALSLAVACGAVGLGMLRQGTIYRSLSATFAEGKVIGSQDEFELLSNMDELIPEDSVILGDPLSGVVYAPVIGNRDSVFTQFNFRGSDRDGGYLLMKFSNMDWDHRVCELVHHYGITHFYSDEDFRFRGLERSRAVPGMYPDDIEALPLTLVAEAGSARLWSISGCGGPIQTKDWWDFDDRSQTYLSARQFQFEPPGNSSDSFQEGLR